MEVKNSYRMYKNLPWNRSYASRVNTENRGKLKRTNIEHVQNTDQNRTQQNKTEESRTEQHKMVLHRPIFSTMTNMIHVSFRFSLCSRQGKVIHCEQQTDHKCSFGDDVMSLLSSTLMFNAAVDKFSKVLLHALSSSFSIVYSLTIKKDR